MVSTGARNTARNDLALFRYERLHHAHIFVIENEVEVRAESADFASVEATAATAAFTASIVTVFISAIVAMMSL
jgi:hypothetical protein